MSSFLPLNEEAAVKEIQLKAVTIFWQKKKKNGTKKIRELNQKIILFSPEKIQNQHSTSKSKGFPWESEGKHEEKLLPD